MITDMKDAKIFQPLQLGRTTLKNRIAMAPMSMHYEATNGTVPKQLADIFVRRAEGGAGYVVIDAVTVDHKYWYIGKTTALDKDSLVPQFKRFATRVKDAGSELIPQIIHPGPESICAMKGITPIGPSINTNANGDVSRPATIKEIQKIIKQYGKAARRAEEAGCGGIALHAAHAYMLPGAFLSPLRNKRMDEYGGTIDNRARLILEIIEECRKNVSEDFPIILRISGSERIEGGNSLEEMLYLAPKFEAAGVNMLEVSGGVQYEDMQDIIPSHSKKIGRNVYEASEIKKVVNIPVFVVGKINDIRYAADIVERGLVDGVSLGRPLLADPDLANKFKEGREDDIRPCISCHFGCLARIFQVDMKTMSSKDISCALNPRCGMENHYNITKADVIKKVAVVGGGIAGMEAARVAALRGHSVDLYEKTDRLGGVFNEASAFDFKDDDRRLLAWYKKQIKDAGVNVKFNTEFKVEDKANYDVVFVATGASEKRLDNIPGFDQPNVRYAVDVLDKQDIKDQNVVIIGGGLTGCELAYDLARKNKKVSVVEALPTIMNVEGLAAPNYNMLVELMEYYHVDLYKNATVKEYKDGKLMIDVMTTNEPNINNRARMMSLFGVHHTPKAIEADTVVVSVGYKSNQTLYDSIKGENVYLLGDAIQPGNLMTAIWGAYTTALKI